MRPFARLSGLSLEGLVSVGTWPPPKGEKPTPSPLLSFCSHTPQHAGDVSPHPESSASPLQNEGDDSVRLTRPARVPRCESGSVSARSRSAGRRCAVCLSLDLPGSVVAAALYSVTKPARRALPRRAPPRPRRGSAV